MPGRPPGMTPPPIGGGIPGRAIGGGSPFIGGAIPGRAIGGAIPNGGGIPGGAMPIGGGIPPIGGGRPGRGMGGGRPNGGGNPGGDIPPGGRGAMVGVPPLGPKAGADWRASHACLAASSAVCIWSRPPRGGRGSASGPQEWAGPAGRSPTSPSSKPTPTIFAKVLGILTPTIFTPLVEV